MSANNKIRLLLPLENQDECSYLTDLAKHNSGLNRHDILIAIDWHYMGERIRFGKRTRYYANLDFDNPCLTFTQTEAWFITLYMAAFAHGAMQFVDYSARFGGAYRGVPWYIRVMQNHFAV